MENNDQVQAEEQAQENLTDSAEQLRKEKETLAQELQAERERAKKEISGLNRKVSELEKERMTDEEKRDAEVREKTEAAKEAERKLKDYELQLARVKAFNEKGIRSDVYEAAAKIAGAQSADDIQSATDELANVITKLVNSGVEQYKDGQVQATHKPRAAGDADKLTRADLLNMPDSEIKNLPSEIYREAMKR